MHSEFEDGHPLSSTTEAAINGHRRPGCEIPVPLCIDGRRYVVGLELNFQEHVRRQRAGLGAVTSTGLLHALWEFPYGISFPARSFEDMDRATLMGATPGWVERRGDDFLRLYQPVGAVRSITVSDTSLARAVTKAASHSPTVRRTAVWRTSTTSESPKTLATLMRAKVLGIGVLIHNEKCKVELVAPADATRGRPVVYRWWQAELAYRNWVSSREPTESTAALV